VTDLPQHKADLVPLELERAYRKDPAAFSAWLDKTLPAEPDSILLQAWHARLTYQEVVEPKANNNLLLYTIFIATLAWAFAKIPAYVTVEEEWFYPRFIPVLVVAGLIAYFNLVQRYQKTLHLASALFVGLVLLLQWLFPFERHSDSLMMSALHMPMVLLSALGLVFSGGEWKSVKSRIEYIRYGGELLIFTALVLLGGGVLTALTLGLFGLIGIQIGEWLFNYVVLWGAMSAPLVATWLWDQVQGRQSRLASMIANVFSPLFLLMTVGYLTALLGEDRSPLEDREFLIVFNVLLLVVWGITVFSVMGRGDRPSRLLDLTNLCLVGVTLVIDAIALSAILYRVVEFGITPNRIAVTGANALIFIHLLWIALEYLKAFGGRGSAEVLKTTIARYLPVYTAWSMFVVVLLPVIFGFE
jgi:hypothetical protein